MEARKSLALLGFLIGLGALVLQFSLSIPLSLSNGYSLPAALVRFFSFYTILTNITLVLVYLSALTAWSWLAWFRSPITQGMMAGVMILVMAFYHFLLSGLWAPEGLFKVADITLHYITPILYALWWLFAGRSGALRWAAIPVMLIPSLIYVVYVMIRGAIVTEYPYPVLEADKLGYGPVAINILAVAVALAVLFAIATTIDTLLARRKPA